MERKYNHLRSEERDLIAVRNAEGKGLEAIAKEIGRSASTVSRELRRNKSSKGYLALDADKQAMERKSKAHQRTRIPDGFTRLFFEKVRYAA